MEMNLIFIHEHEVSIATAKKLSNTCYSLDGYLIANKNDSMKLPVYGIYFSIYCQICKNYLLKTKSTQDFLTIPKKMKGFKNIFNTKGKLEYAFFDDNPNNNMKNNEECSIRSFYKFDTTLYDSNNVYIGTDNEREEFFHKNYIDLKNKIAINEAQNKDNKTKLEEGEKELKKYHSGIFLGGDNEKLPKAYDIISGANSILSLNDSGWEIKYPKSKETYDKLKEKSMIIAGVIGNRNKGKSFILGKLTDFKIPQGFSIKTEGISVCFGDKDEHCVAILDSAGQEVPLLNSAINQKKIVKNEQKIELKNNKENNDEKEKKEEKELDETQILEICLRDKLITERFLEEFIIQNSDILLLVVGNITLNEQKILTRIKNSLKNQKYLYVIHNLLNYQSKDQVEDYIKNTLKKLYGTEILEYNFININGNYHTKYYVEKKSKITHLLFVNDYCEIADYYNKPTIEFLKKNLEVVQKRTQFSVIENCKDFFFKIQGDFLVELVSKKDMVVEENRIKINNKEIKLKKVLIDEIGKTIINDIDNPKYNYYTEKNDLIINVELPGPDASIQSKINHEEGFYIFDFIGQKSGDNSNKEEKHILSKNLKEKTDFKFLIYISKKDITILPNDKGKIQFYEKSYDKGIFTFKYHILCSDNENDYE